jgi:hypothetical protein
MEAYDRTVADAREGIRASAIILAVVAIFVLIVTTVGIAGLALRPLIDERGL